MFEGAAPRTRMDGLDDDGDSDINAPNVSDIQYHVGAQKVAGQPLEIDQAISLLTSPDALQRIGHTIARHQSEIRRLNRVLRVLEKLTSRSDGDHAEVLHHKAMLRQTVDPGLEERIVEHLREHGPQLPKAIGDALRVHHTVIGKAVRASELLERMDDRRIKLVAME